MISVLVIALVLAGTGALGSRIGREAWTVLKADVPVFTSADIEAAAGEGIMVGLLGGFRAVTADFLWVRTNAVWEEQDLPGAQTLIRLVTTVDSRPLIFWVNGARMIGYDMPVWRIDAAARGGADVPAVVQTRIYHEQAMAALAVLERARSHHPGEPLLLIEMANLRQRKLGDLAGAAELYRRAAHMPGAPFYAARIYGEMLKQLGRERDAYAWLVEVHRGLPQGNAMAMADIVLGRIRDLEERLNVPASERYVPTKGEDARSDYVR